MHGVVLGVLAWSGCSDAPTCEHTPINQGVFGQIISVSDLGGTPNRDLVGAQVDAYAGQQHTSGIGSTLTDDGGYQFAVPPGTYTLCSNALTAGTETCGVVSVPAGVVEFNLTWIPLTGPPLWAQLPTAMPTTIRPCTYPP